ncbi:SIRT5 [Lepeophtheirus salmonis]|uniref:SIRT5 n=1 Tax=Lepeophtheirus salmonis TaxID=72036 RepID=A0A7R8D2B1_LEPSM|nr:SIRT5 [Lepeophtheirus salmonis]CAF2975333.1 SIRT5 [Lepeophtheirus salmonis]
MTLPLLRTTCQFLHRNRSPWSLMSSLLEYSPSSSYAAFKDIFSRSKNIVVLTGAGISAESGVPTFRGPGGYWRKYQAQNLATPEAFRADPSLVWEFYHYRREVMLSKQPNPAHIALARLEKKLKEEEGGLKKLIIITQNIDELHKRAGSTNILELHGSLFRVRCTSCGIESLNYDSPICQSLLGKGAPEPHVPRAGILKKDLPSCTECGGLIRPAVVWFGERLNDRILGEAQRCYEPM